MRLLIRRLRSWEEMRIGGTESSFEEGEKSEGKKLGNSVPDRMSSVGDARRRLNCVERVGMKGRNSGKDRK